MRVSRFTVKSIKAINYHRPRDRRQLVRGEDRLSPCHQRGMFEGEVVLVPVPPALALSDPC